MLDPRVGQFHGQAGMLSLRRATIAARTRHACNAEQAQRTETPASLSRIRHRLPELGAQQELPPGTGVAIGAARNVIALHSPERDPA